MARGDSNFTSETARIAAGRPKSRSLAPLRAILPFLRPYRGRIAVAVLATAAQAERAVLAARASRLRVAALTVAVTSSVSSRMSATCELQGSSRSRAGARKPSPT